MGRKATRRERHGPAPRAATGATRWIWRTALGAVVAGSLVACGPVRQTTGEWTLLRAAACARDPGVDAAAAMDRAEHHLREMVSAAWRRDAPPIDAARPVLACGLRKAQHSAVWTYYADDRDIWLLSFQEDGELVALAAVDATTGVVLAITQGVWGGAVDR